MSIKVMGNSFRAVHTVLIHSAVLHICYCGISKGNNNYQFKKVPMSYNIICKRKEGKGRKTCV